MMEGHQHQHQHQHHQHQYQYSSSSVHIDHTGGGGGGGPGPDRFPQWSFEETREFLMIRTELDPNFMETKRNKLLWEVIATKMREKGYNRSPEQCKCKWKNLVTRYKGCQTMETESMRQQFPFYNELQTIFTARMQRMLWIEAESGGASGSKKKAAQLSSDEEDDIELGERAINTPSKKKRKIRAGSSSTGAAAGGINVMNSLKEIVDEFMKQQMQMEMQWLKVSEAREEERRKREMEWRQTMEALENERLMMDKRWREREEQRRIREEARAEKRDALITALLNRLLRRED